VREAAAEYARESLLDFCIGRFRVLIEKGLCSQHHPAQAEAALRRLLVDERLLKRMR
jgi:hypothetical protein